MLVRLDVRASERVVVVHPVAEPMDLHQVVPPLHLAEKLTATLVQDEVDVRTLRMMFVAIGGVATDDGKSSQSNGSAAMLLWGLVQEYLNRQLSDSA